MRGFTPHPSRVIDPAPNTGNGNMYHPNHFPVEQSITQTHLRRGRLYFCELGAPLVPRRNSFAKERLKLCELGARTAGHGLGGGTPPAGCFASGENDKKEAVRECILSAALFFVFIAPVGFLFGSQSFVRKEEGGKSFLLRRTGAGPMALLQGVRGPHRPLLIRSTIIMRNNPWKSRLLHRKMGPGARPLVRGL